MSNSDPTPNEISNPGSYSGEDTEHDSVTSRISEPPTSDSDSSFGNLESDSEPSNRRLNLDNGRPTLPYNLLSGPTRYLNSDPYAVTQEANQNGVTPFPRGFNPSSGASSSSLNRPTMLSQLGLPENAYSVTRSYHPVPPMRTPQGNRGDRFHGLRMDTENMSYEELLALEERIGNAKLKPKSRHIRRKKYGEALEAERCVICLEKLVKGDVVGVLDCGHQQFHIRCIKEWIEKYRNKCPLCNKRGSKGK